MIFVSEIVNELIKEIGHSFSATNERDLCIYQVGSTLRGIRTAPIDIDLWIVRLRSASKSQMARLTYLRECMANGKAASGLVDASDETTRQAITRAVCFVERKFSQVRMSPNLGLAHSPNPTLKCRQYIFRLADHFRFLRISFSFRNFHFTAVAS